MRLRSRGDQVVHVPGLGLDARVRRRGGAAHRDQRQVPAPTGLRPSWPPPGLRAAALVDGPGRRLRADAGRAMSARVDYCAVRDRSPSASPRRSAPRTRPCSRCPTSARRSGTAPTRRGSSRRSCSSRSPPATSRSTSATGTCSTPTTRPSGRGTPGPSAGLHHPAGHRRGRRLPRATSTRRWSALLDGDVPPDAGRAGRARAAPRAAAPGAAGDGHQARAVAQPAAAGVRRRCPGRQPALAAGPGWIEPRRRHRRDRPRRRRLRLRQRGPTPRRAAARRSRSRRRS